MKQELLTVAGYAEKRKIPTITVYKWVNRGNIKHVKKFGRILIKEDAEPEFVNK